MNKEQLIDYLNGLFQMASSLSDYIGPSYIKVDCYLKEEFKEEFCNNYNIKGLDIKKSNKTIETALLDWFGTDEKIIESILYWLNINNIKIKTIYYFSEDLLNNLNNQHQDFYFLEDIIIAESSEYIIILLLGNNE